MGKSEKTKKKTNIGSLGKLEVETWGTREIPKVKWGNVQEEHVFIPGLHELVCGLKNGKKVSTTAELSLCEPLFFGLRRYYKSEKAYRFRKKVANNRELSSG